MSQDNGVITTRQILLTQDDSSYRSNRITNTFQFYFITEWRKIVPKVNTIPADTRSPFAAQLRRLKVTTDSTFESLIPCGLMNSLLKSNGYRTK